MFALDLYSFLYHTCALLGNMQVKCWGDNYFGQLGDGGSNTNQNTPVYVLIDASLQGTYRYDAEPGAIAAGYQHTCALTPSGRVECWGLNDYGQLGDAATSPGPGLCTRSRADTRQTAHDRPVYNVFVCP